jgi:hypothetical protein
MREQRLKTQSIPDVAQQANLFNGKANRLLLPMLTSEASGVTYRAKTVGIHTTITLHVYYSIGYSEMYAHKKPHT